MQPLKEKVSITLDSDIVQKIKDMAEADDRSFSQYVNMILRERVTKKMTKKKNNMCPDSMPGTLYFIGIASLTAYIMLSSYINSPQKK